MRVRNSILLLLSLGLFALSLSGGPEANANEAKWRKRLGRADIDEVYKSIQLAGRNKDEDAALPLVERAINAKWPHIAVAAGDALHEIGPKPFKNKDIKIYFRWEHMSTIGAYYAEMVEIAAFNGPSKYSGDSRRKYTPGPSSR